MSNLTITGTAGYTMGHVARWTVLGNAEEHALAYVKTPDLAEELVAAREREAVLVEALQGLLADFENGCGQAELSPERYEELRALATNSED